MIRSGRPLRFLCTTLAAWTALRIALLWPEAPTVTSVIQTVIPPIATVPLARAVPMTTALAPKQRRPREVSLKIEHAVIDETRRERLVALAMAGLVRFGEPQVTGNPMAREMAPPPLSFPISPLVVHAATRKRWSLDLWLTARGGSNRGTGFGGGELGGSQAGARFAYTLDRHLAAFARIAAPLSGRGREAAVGIDWQPTRVPVRAVVEARLPLDGGSAVPAAGLVGGFGPVVRHGLRLEGYGQAGVLARRGGEGFTDGAIRATRQVGAIGGIAFDLGAGAWGGAQRDSARLDLGPTLGATVPLADHAIRVAIDWRERIAGRARPDSGPALTIGASF